MNQLTLSMYLLIQSALRLRQSSATLIESLRRVMIVYPTYPRDLFINLALMTFAYRKAMKHFRAEIGDYVVVRKTF